MKEIIINGAMLFGTDIAKDIDNVVNNDELESIIIKNLQIDNDFIKILNTCKNLRKIWFIGCEINSDIELDNITSITIDRCNPFNYSLLNNNIKELSISFNKEIDISMISHLNLESLKIDNTEVINLKEIENFINLRKLFLQEIDIYENIDFKKMKSLKSVNLDGSKVASIDRYLDQFTGTEIKLSFKKKNLKIN